jgi:hypothetical protein
MAVIRHIPIKSSCPKVEKIKMNSCISKQYIPNLIKGLNSLPVQDAGEKLATNAPVAQPYSVSSHVRMGDFLNR